MSSSTDTPIHPAEREAVARVLFENSAGAKKRNGDLRETWDHICCTFPEAAATWRDLADKAIAAMRARAAAPSAPDGWVMVPRKATYEMCKAAHDGPQMAGDELMHPKEENWLAEMWEAMLAAAPCHNPPQRLSEAERKEIADLRIWARGGLGWAKEKMRYVLAIIDRLAPQDEKGAEG